jgi:hypothetical protein
VPFDFMQFERSWPRVFTYHMALTFDTDNMQHILNLS